MPPSITPRVFVSAVSSDLRSARKVVNDALTRIECLPIEESIFGTEYGMIREMIARKIESCQAVIHLVGRDYGGEPDPQKLPSGQPRRSWTQLEYDLARQKNKKLYVFICDPEFPFAEAEKPEPNGKVGLQAAHRTAVLTDSHLWHSVKDMDELCQQVENLKVPLDEVRAELRRQQIRYQLLIGIAALSIFAVLAGVIYGVSRVGKKVKEHGEDVVKKVAQAQEKTAEQIEATAKKTDENIERSMEKAVQVLANPAILADRIRKEIHATAETKIKMLPDQIGRGRMIADIEKERDLALGRVDDLIKLIQEGLKEGASPVFQRAAEILEKEGSDEALRYLENRRPSTLETARRHAEQAKTAQAHADAEKEQRNNTLQALVLEAKLLETKLQWKPALQLRERVAELAPDWFQARTYLGMLLRQLARNQEAEPHSRAALVLASNPSDEAIALSSLAQLLQDTNRLAEAEPLMRRALAIDEQAYEAEPPIVARDLNNLAALLGDTNRLAEAEPLMRRALAIDEQAYGAAHPNIARDLNNLAQLLQATNRLVEAEPLMRCALAIDEQAYGTAHPKVAIRLNNLAALLQYTNRLQEAEPLYCRALAIDEQAYETAHPKVAIRLNNLAALLRATNRLVEAEPLVRRALAIDEQAYGVEHPKVAIRLSSLAALLQDTNRLAEAEPLVRRGLVIVEQSYGAEHPDVANYLNELALLLHAKAENAEEKHDSESHSTLLAKAEPLMRQHVVIFVLFTHRTGHEHPHLRAALANYRGLLESMKLPDEKNEERLKEVIAATGPLKAIVPEVERLLGPAKPVAEVLAALDHQYKTDGKADVYFLKPNQPLAQHLDELLRPNPESLIAAGGTAFRRGDYAIAVAHYEESLKLPVDKPNQAATKFTTRMIRAAALRELGEVEPARDELRKLLSGLREGDKITSLVKGCARYHLALCEWRLDDRDTAQREAEESLKVLGDDEADAFQKKQTEQLLADLKENKPLPPLAKVDAVAALEQARVRFRARAELATLPLDQSALPLLDQMLGPAKSTKEIFEELDRQYREQNKPAVWFLPLSQPIAPHLDELLGPVPEEVEKK